LAFAFTCLHFINATTVVYQKQVSITQGDNRSINNNGK
jgi:hypothetical protein